MATITRTSDREREQLRRSALGADQGPSAKEQAGGGFDIARTLLRALGDPQDPTNVSFPFLRRMRRDHMVSMGLHFINMPVVKAPWYFEADDARAAAFADNLIRPIFGTLALCILRFLWAGYSPGAKAFTTVNPGWVYVEDGVVKQVWDNGAVDAIVYKSVTPLRPEFALPVWDASGAFKGIAYDAVYGGGSFIIDGQEKTDVDLLHSFWAVHDQENEDGSPFGFPRIAHCAPIFHMYRYIWTLLARAFENSADPGPVMRFPREELPERDDDGTLANNAQIALRLGTRRRSGSTIALPSDPYVDYQDRPTGIRKWDIDYPESRTNFEALLAFIDYLESAKLRSLWLQEQGLIEGSGATSSRNVASEFGSKRDESQWVLMRQVCDIIMDSFVKPAMAMNMPTYQGRLEMKFLGLGQDDEDVVRQAFQLMGQQNVGKFGIDFRRLAEARGFPMTNATEFAAELKRAADQAEKQANTAPPPQVTPTQGRRALVTQTGFGEVLYHQLGDELNLAEVAAKGVETVDGDFVASLPRNDTFSERAIVDQARVLRSASQAFLAWAYRDFAIYLGKQRKLELSDEELLAEEAEPDSDHFLVGDQAKALAAKLLRGWRPRQDRVDSYSERVRRTLGRAYDRTAAIHLSRLGSDARVNPIDRTAAKWLDDQGAKAVKSILNTTREQLAEALAEGVREGKTAKEIAADIRSHFEDFPASRAATIARTEIGEAYNFATVQAGMAAGVKKAQLVDGNVDLPCKRRNGRIIDLIEALEERLNHPNCTFTVRLLPKASARLTVRTEQLDEGLRGRYDTENDVVLLSTDLSPDEGAEYLLAVGAAFV